MSRGVKSVWPAAAWVVCLAATQIFAAAPSGSKLAPHFIASFSPGGGQIVAAHPRVIKILDITDAMMSAVRTYKSGTAGGLVVFRRWVNTAQKPPYTSAQNAATCADDFWDTVLAPALNSLSPSDRALIDYVEGPNECENCPCWGSVADAQWYGNFWVRLAQRIGDAGYRPCAFSIPVGNPPGDQNFVHQCLDAIVPALRACKARGGAWSYHSYTNSWSTDVGVEYWYSLRYRQFYEYFATNYPDLNDMPLILTEGGIDTGGSPTGSGWQAHVDATTYENWLSWYDTQIRADSYVIGVTLFQIGDTGWPSFNIEPIAGWLAGHLTSTPGIPALGTSVTSLSASVVVNHNATQLFTISNLGTGSFTYTISDDVSWLSASPTSGTITTTTDNVNVFFTAGGLSVGTYTGNIMVNAPAANGSPKVIPVTMTVTLSPIPGDLDNDLDVDGTDFTAFMNCVTGPGGGPVTGNCTRVDFDGDHDVDQADFGKFQRCVGATVQGGANCAQ